jgi:hypothetical protein
MLVTLCIYLSSIFTKYFITKPNQKIMRRLNSKVLLVLGALLITAATTFVACKKKNDVDNGNSNVAKFDNSVIVTASISGQLFDENGVPLAGATVSTGNHSFTTSGNGLFYFRNISCKQNAQLLTISKAGFYTGYRTLKIKKGEDNFTRVRVLKMDNAQSFTTTAGATISAAGGASVKFDANTIVTKGNNAAYNGTATIFAKTIRANDANIAELVPGALRGVATSGEENYLTTYGMLAVEMFDQTGAALQIAPGKTAEIHMPIESNQMASAPAEIPLWYFDATSGMWQQEGSAKKVGGEYVGTVKHFSYWNCDYGGPICNFDAVFTETVSGNPLVGYQVKLISGGTTGTRSSYTGASGNVTGGIPTNSSFTLELVDGTCGTSIYTTTFSSTTAAVNLGTIAVTLPATSAATISGTVVDCGGLAISNSLVFITVGSGVVVPITPSSTGTFSWSGILCSNPASASITAYDLTNNVNGTVAAVLTPGANAVGNVAACGTLSEYLNMTINDGTTTRTFSFLEPAATFNTGQNATSTSIYVSEYNTSGGTTQGKNGSIVFDGQSTGIFNITGISAGEYGATGQWYTTSDSSGVVPSVPINITTYGASIGNFINGTFSGTYTDAATSSTYTISGSVGAKRDF